jgi:hypothetical protein
MLSSIRAGLLLGCAALLSFSATVNAAVTTYTYTGSSFTSATSPYTTNDSVTGSITLANALASNLTNFTTVVPTSFSFSAGVSTLTNATPNVGSLFAFKTDAFGDISQWQIAIFTGSVFQFSIGTTNAPSLFTPTDQIIVNGGNTAFGQIQNSPGTWAVTSVPEPESYAMFLAGLGLMGGIARRRQQPV